MAIVSTIPENCKRCYTCVRECPAKAIKVVAGQATVMEERCIVCGNCVKVCAQKAKLIEDDTSRVREMLAGDAPVFACLAPSFPAAFAPIPPGKVIAAVRALGFSEVWEVAFGAEMVGREYTRLLEKSLRTGQRVITTPCPAIVTYVEKFVPQLRDALASIVSPMIATARAIRHRRGPDVRVVFIGPCIAKKNEIRDPAVAGAVDAVLSFVELVKMFDAAGIAPVLMGESGFDGPPCRLARSFPISGGLLRTAGLSMDILENDIVITEGKDRVLDALRDLAEGHSGARLFDVLFCEGCISGPKMLNTASVIVRKEILADFVTEQNCQTTQRELAEALDEFRDVDLNRTFTRQNLVLRRPAEAEIARTLQAMRKFTEADQLNCGACGYRSCREKAVAVCQGLAEIEMCLPFLVEELEDTCRRLRESHEELEATHHRLLHAERLASVGQLSAGIAHEINNPLGTILVYSHMLLKELQAADPRRQDIQLIAGEASRCRDIVRGLLDFARQSRVSKEPTDLAGLMDEVMRVMGPRADEARARLACRVQEALPPILLDKAQIKQALINLIANAVDAVKEGGQVAVDASLNGPDTLQIRVSDNGCGIPSEHLPKLFTPFFTTKPAGRGTGLGLAIVYGIVKMHRGEIAAESEEGKGATFVIHLPLGTGELRETNFARTQAQPPAPRP
ncbi:MAG: [Fe-Fe] hydrogenase large subunit C-terminal domain-containing protein [Planctomycetota bacterium]